MRRLRTLSLALLCSYSAAVLANPMDERFHALTDKDWAFRLAEFPDLKSEENPEFVADRLGHAAEADQRRRHAFWLGLRQELDSVNVDALSPDQRINHAIFRRQLDSFIADYELGGYLMPLNSDSSFYTYLSQMPGRQPFETEAHYRAYLGKLKDFPRYFADYTALMREGLKRGMTVPQVVLVGRELAIKRHAEVADPVKSVYYSPFLTMPKSLPAERQAALRGEAKKLIAEAVLPAYRDFLKFFTQTYVPGARKDLAATRLPNGQAYYQQQIREYTTLDLPPEKIHAIGLSEVKRIRAEMDGIIRQVGFKGSFAEFLSFLRSDPQFYAKTPRELLMHARDIAKRIDDKLPSQFKLLPRQPYGVVPVPEDIAESYTAGRYVGAPAGGMEAGDFWVNTSKLESRPLYALPALALHEAVPGHHLQNALAAEQGEQPAFRRLSYISAYGEGWALYSEHLGVEMGIYETPYEHFGRLTYEMWRACRLVVDTGIHAKGWSRDQALDFMRDNTALSLHEIGTEIDRYISWPGQALSYKLGELKIRELRARAEKTLGEKFDRRAFHDTILALGSVPLDVLEREMDAWIAKQG
ncbi:MAG: DUF885 family protein [Gammaproteobacteria bacterium]|nr:DUF885 family protein [Gammaproteobacteria bacterium]